MPQVQSNLKVLENGTQALLGDTPQTGDDEEFVDLSKDSTGSAIDDAAPTAAVKKGAPAPKADADAGTGADDEELPPELKGKTPAQLAKMYREAQSVIGRQGSELGEFRKKADMLIQASLASIAATRAAAPGAKPAAEDKPAQPDDSEFFAKPNEAVSKAIENSPVIQEIRRTLGAAAAEREKARAKSATEKFMGAHPDAEEIIRDPEFQKWVRASRVRAELLTRAHQKFDYEAGDEVFSTWKALKGVKPAAAAAGSEDTSVSDAARTLAAAKAKRAAALKDAAAPTGGGGAPKESGSKKIYRRADVLRLMEEDPKRYEMMADEIALAYREKRVR